MTDPFAALPGAVFDGAALSHLGSPAREQNEQNTRGGGLKTLHGGVNNSGGVG